MFNPNYDDGRGEQRFGPHPNNSQHAGGGQQGYSQQPGYQQRPMFEQQSGPFGYGQPGPQQFGPNTKERSTQTQGWIIAGGAILAAIGCFVPWASILGVSINGMEDGADGVIFLPMAVVILSMGAVVARGPRKLVFPIVAGLVALLLAIFALIDFTDTISVAEGEPLLSVGAGLPMIILGAIISTAAAIWAIIAMRRR